MGDVSINQEQAFGIVAGKTDTEVAAMNPNKPLNVEKGLALTRENTQSVLTGFAEFQHSLSRHDTAKSMLLTGFDKDGNRQARPGSRDENKSLTDVTDITNIYTKFLSKGFDGLTTAEKGRARDRVVDFVNSIPALKEAFSDSGSVSISRIHDILRNPEVKSSLAAVLSDVYNPANLEQITALETRLLGAEVKLRQADAELPNLKKEATRLQARKKDLEATKKAFEDDAAKGPVLSALEKDTQVIEYINAEKYLNEVRAAHLANPRLTPDTEVIRAEAKVTALLPTAEVQDYIRLNKERNSFQPDLNTVNEQLPKILEEVAVKETLRTQAKLEVDSTLRERHRIADLFEEQVKNAVKVAAQNLMMTRAQSYIDRAPTALKEAADAAEQAARDAVQKALGERWKENYRAFPAGSERTRINGKKATEDYRSLMETDPKEFAKKLIDETPGLSQEEKDKLKGNAEYLDAMGNDAAAKALAAHISSGGKFTESDIRALADTSWGQEAFQKWVEKDPQVNEFIQQMKDKGLTDGKLKNIIDRLGGKWGVAILLVILGLVGATFGLPYAALAKGGIEAAKFAVSSLQNIPSENFTEAAKIMGEAGKSAAEADAVKAAAVGIGAASTAGVAAKKIKSHF